VSVANFVWFSASASEPPPVSLYALPRMILVELLVPGVAQPTTSTDQVILPPASESLNTAVATTFSCSEWPEVLLWDQPCVTAGQENFGALQKAVSQYEIQCTPMLLCPAVTHVCGTNRRNHACPDTASQNPRFRQNIFGVCGYVARLKADSKKR
jgi:hypothetical protein